MDEKLTKVIERIKKCLALAQSDNPNEAATAMRQAQKLMREHNLTESSLHISKVKENRVKFGNGARRAPEWMNCLASTCALAFDCHVLMTTNRFLNEKEVVYIGIGEAPKMAEYCYEVLARQLVHARNEYCKSLKKQHGYVPRGHSNSFALGWVLAVKSKLDKMKIEGVTENALVKVSDSIIDDYLKKMFGEIPQMKSSKALHESSSLTDGYKEGQKASLYQPVDNDNDSESSLLLTAN